MEILKRIFEGLIFILCSIGIIVGILSIGVMLNGCASQNPVPVAYDCPELELPPEPIAATQKLTVNSRPDEVVKAYVATLRNYKGWIQTVEAEVEKTK